MSTTQHDPASARSGGPEQAGEPSEEELRAAYEAELSRITAVDMIAQAAVSLLNIGARRLGPPPGRRGRRRRARQRDLEQVRDAIDGARALLEILERRIPQELGPLRDALSQLQMAYAREVGAAAPGVPQAAAGEQPAPGAPPQAPAAEDAPGGRSRGRRSPAAGSGCPAAELDRAAGGRVQGVCAATGCRRARHLAGRHDRLPARLRRVERSPRAIRPTNVRATILARHANQTAEDFC